jgi:hypothetical protein
VIRYLWKPSIHNLIKLLGPMLVTGDELAEIASQTLGVKLAFDDVSGYVPLLYLLIRYYLTYYKAMRPAVFSASRLPKMKPKDSIYSNTTLLSGKARPTTSQLIAFMTLQAHIQLSRPGSLKSIRISLCRRWLCRGWNLTVHRSGPGTSC